MNIEHILNGKFDNHILPFLWIHGEEEEVYRDNVRAIYNANIRAFCIEARPHKAFCKQQWWDDLAILLDEAEKLGMKVWILDDKHFPTGYANGGVEKMPAHLRRQSVLSKEYVVRNNHIKLNVNQRFSPPISYPQLLTNVLNKNGGRHNRFNDNRVLSITAIQMDDTSAQPISLNQYVKNGILDWNSPPGTWKVVVCFLSRNCGSHRSYINMMDKESCKIQIEQVYEPHYKHFGDKFGNTIAGFFSDEPELGNGFMYKMYNFLGTPQDLPWSNELESKMQLSLGNDYADLLPLLWHNDGNNELTAKVRFIYMNHVSRLVEENFSKQIGIWCRNHGVEYIGHVIEDNNQHARTGTSLGHFFRGLKWQTMSGIDIIGGSIYPQKEKMEGNTFIWKKQPIDGEFYHFALAKLGSSLGELNPQMKDRTMCELFGNYSWSEGIRLEKFLIDHCMVRGVNYFVPHAFSCKAYPDKDCPPHFYAHGNDPLYRHFGELMGYTNRITSLFDGSRTEATIGILYHGEAEWCSVTSLERANPQDAGSKDAINEGYMLMQKPARILQENQIDFRFVPSDVFLERDFYKTEIKGGLTINGYQHDILIVPYSKYITAEFAESIRELIDAGCKVAFLEQLPKGTCQGKPLPDILRKCDVVTLDSVLDYVNQWCPSRMSLMPKNKRIRARHVVGEVEAVLFVNEDSNAYKGHVSLPWKGESYLYDPWRNCKYKAEYEKNGILLDLRPSESIIVIKGNGSALKENAISSDFFNDVILLNNFTVSTCRSKDYPKFKSKGNIKKMENFGLSEPKFSGFIAYETSFQIGDFSKIILKIMDAYEGVEVFVNGKSVGIEILSECLFDITPYCNNGRNQLRIEVATTLERENAKKVRDAAPTGITGDVYLLTE